MTGTKEMEDIFAYAVALDQSGKQKNTIFCGEKTIFILNYDKTILMSISLKTESAAFEEPICFDANDYDSPMFRIEGNSIIFEINKDGYSRKKKCGTSAKGLTFENISDMYLRLSRNKVKSKFGLRKEIMPLLSEDLSHVEIVYKDDAPMLIQRDIFSGTVIEIEKEKSQGFGFVDQDDLQPFEPIGLRTVDLDALFQYDSELSFEFTGKHYFKVKGKTTPMIAILSQCLYDELGTVNVLLGGK